MDLPVSDLGPVKEDSISCECTLSDFELVHKIAQLLLSGLAMACVDNTTGELFRSPSSVAVDVRKEMVEYLIRRSETYVAEYVIQEGENDQETSDNPSHIVLDLMDDFASSKKNLLSRVSGWLLSESREDKIDDFVQEMETNGFWLMDRREAVADTLLRNLDFKRRYHCAMKFESSEQLEMHNSQCDFRPLRCMNEGCNANFCAVNMEKHDVVCPFKMIPCEQKCSQTIARREMDRHCLTVCPMKLVNCPFYQVGCQTTITQCTIEQHCSEFLNSHLLYVLQVINKQETSMDNLKQRVALLEKSQSLNELSEALDVRSLTLLIKEQEAKMKTLEREISRVSERTI